MICSQKRSIRMLIFICFVIAYRFTLADDAAKIFPIPQEMHFSGGNLILDEETWILIPEDAHPDDLFLARLLTKELSDHYLLALKTMSGIMKAWRRKVPAADFTSCIDGFCDYIPHTKRPVRR